MNETIKSSWMSGVAPKAMRMIMWRVVAIATGPLATLWMVRCLGPANLGISGMMGGILANALVLAHLNQDFALVRRYKEAGSIEERNSLITLFVTQRFCFALILATLGLLWVAAFGLPKGWELSLIMSLLLLMMLSNQGDWVLQAQENQSATYRTIGLASLLSATLVLVFFREPMRAGSDLAVQCASAVFTLCMTWTIALRGKHRVRISFHGISAIKPMLWAGRWIFLSGVVTTAYMNVPLVLLGDLSGLDQLGEYKTAILVGNVAHTFLNIVPVLLYPRYIEWNREGPHVLWQRQMHLLRVSVLAIVPAVAVAFLVVPAVYPHVFGPRFIGAALPCCVLLTCRLLWAVGSIFTGGLLAQHQDRTILVILTSAAGVSLALNYLLVPTRGMMGTSLANLASELVVVVGAACVSRHLIAKTGAAP